MEKGFTLLELLLVLTLMALFLTPGLILASEWNFFKEQEELTRVVNTLKKARNKAIREQKEYGVAFSKQGYYLIKDRKEAELSSKKRFAKDVKLKEITLPEYETAKEPAITNAVFFKELGNLAGHNGRIVLKFSSGKIKELVYTSNAGQLDIRGVE